MRIRILVFVTLALAFMQNEMKAQEFAEFKWVNDSVSGRYIEKLAILLPVQIENLPNRFLMQLDLGSTQSVIRGNTIGSFYQKYPDLKRKLDTINLCKFHMRECPQINNLDIKIGDVFDCNVNAASLQGYGVKVPVDSLSPEVEILIGSIGTDVLKGKVLVIDYPNSKMSITDASEMNASDYSFIPFQFLKENEDNRLLLPFTANGQELRVMFDTGASMFQLSAPEKNAKMICDSQAVDSLLINSWGEKKKIIGLESNVELRFGEKVLPQLKVYYDPSNKYDFFYESNNVFGLTGNALFLNDVVVIDYQNKRFGIKKNTH
ncbi:hypothetical protein DF185_06375 [Marinifilum breve]|uniref:Peptidase A2 domain-containing protein n=1 Tax=Marinifilum breve TaxID=2184082 RepID=A0A2V4A0M0_9BACT|nr:hypothetical protein [Marinifilum breve]PXY02269.1 hypothetical protein DF185_06375 [Marinifilum breve]